MAMLTTVALDFGNVLAYPPSGNWMLPPNLPALLGLRNVMKMASNAQALKENTQRGMDFLNKNHLLHTVEEEYEQFRAFYQMMFGGVGMKDLDHICDELARYAAYNENRAVFYDDVLPGIQALKARWRVIVISDTWPSLKNAFAAAGVLPLLDDLVLSCDYGHTKSDGGKLFQTAIERHGVVPAQCLFVDDSASNLAFARDLGFHTAQMDRDGKLEASDYPLVHNLEEVAALAERIVL